MPEVEIFTDGACSGNPGPGGWGAVLRYGTVEKELSGGEAATTNNRMELMAAIAGLEALKRPVPGAALHRQHLSARRHHPLAAGLEGARLAYRRQEAGQERRSVATAGSGGGAARHRMALGARPRRPPGKRARRRPRPRGDRHVTVRRGTARLDLSLWERVFISGGRRCSGRGRRGRGTGRLRRAC